MTLKKMKLIAAVILFSLSSHLTAQDSYQAFSRYDYYTSEQFGEIIVEVPESKMGMSIKVDLVFEYDFVQKGYIVPAGLLSGVPFPMERLHQGDNEITCSFYENEKWIDSRKVNVVLRERKPNEVRIDRTSGGLLVDGLPFFPFGFYCYWPVQQTLAEEEVVKGFNMMSPYWKIEKKNLKERKKFMDRCAALGIKVNYNLCSVAGGGGAGSQKDKDKSPDELKSLLIKEVEAFRDHPALLSWYISDEPVGQGVSPEELQEPYDLIKELDPYHPVSVVFMTPAKAREYEHVMDIVMADPYPLPGGSVMEVSRVISMLKQEFRYEKPVWIVPQAFGGNEWWTREPTADELEVMTYLALINEATGVQYFIRHGLSSFPKSAAAWGNCGAISLETAELIPFLLSGQTLSGLIISQENVQARAWYNKGKIIILAANARNEPAEYTLKLPEIAFSGEVDVLFKNRKLQITEGTITDIIDGYGTRAYQITLKEDIHQERAINTANLIMDPGFEEVVSPGIPASCYARPGHDKGATYFIDSRIAFTGEHSLRLNTPEKGAGIKLSFYRTSLPGRQTYTLSVYGATGQSSNNYEWHKKLFGKGSWQENPEKPLVFQLSAGDITSEQFTLSEIWRKYEVRIDLTDEVSDSTKVIPILELLSKGTAWFDNLSVVPDLELRSDIDAGKNVIHVEISSTHDDVRIFYTLDGSRPDSTSAEYISEPVEISETGLLKVVAYKQHEFSGYLEKEYSVH